MVGTTIASIILKLLLERDCIFNWTSNFSELVFVEPDIFIDKFLLLITESFSCSFTSFVSKLNGAHSVPKLYNKLIQNKFCFYYFK